MCLWKIPWAFLPVLLFLGCGTGQERGTASEGRKTKVEGGAAVGFKISSSAFENMGEIPIEFTSDGKNVSPPLSWSGVPEGAKSLALVVDDPDAPDPKNPRTVWVHWVLYDIPPGAPGLEKGAGNGLAPLPEGSRDGINDWGKKGYGGPSPPIGRHRYFFKLYALDTVLPDLGRADKAALERAMEGHVLAETELIGTYKKKGR